MKILDQANIINFKIKLKNDIKREASQGLWVTFAFDPNLGILLQSKSSFESYLTKCPKLFLV